MDKYCPICTGKLDKNGDCWTTCEFESGPEYPGLDEKHMLERRIKACDARIAKFKRHLEIETRDLEGYKARLADLL